MRKHTEQKPHSGRNVPFDIASATSAVELLNRGRQTSASYLLSGSRFIKLKSRIGCCTAIIVKLYTIVILTCYKYCYYQTVTFAHLWSSCYSEIVICIELPPHHAVSCSVDQILVWTPSQAHKSRAFQDIINVGDPHTAHGERTGASRLATLQKCNKGLIHLTNMVFVFPFSYLLRCSQRTSHSCEDQ